MKNKIYYLGTLIILLLAGCVSCEADKEVLGWSYEEPEKSDIPYLISARATDMVLIYAGGEQRPPWTSEKYKGFVSYIDPETKKEDWLFDGYLIIESQDGRGKLYSEDGGDPTGKSPATKKEWEWLLNKHFEKNGPIDNLNAQVEEVKSRLGEPVRKRQVIYALPVPFWKQTDWGVLEGKKLDFNNIADRTAASSWYIDKVLEEWKKLNPNNLELAGFYWIPEAIWNSPVYIQIAQNVGEYVKSKGDYLYYWIPYWGAGGREIWQSFGFDIAYQQPNSAFKEDATYTVDETVEFAKRNKMAMEFEFYAIVAKAHPQYKPWARNRFIEYLDSFEKNGVFDDYPLSHYQSQRDWGFLYESTIPEDLEISMRYGRTIVERQKKADQLYKEFYSEQK